jgi:hypothetical protein
MSAPTEDRWHPAGALNASVGMRRPRHPRAFFGESRETRGAPSVRGRRTRFVDARECGLARLRDPPRRMRARVGSCGRCRGLPRARVTVSRALRAATPEIWTGHTQRGGRSGRDRVARLWRAGRASSAGHSRQSSVSVSSDLSRTWMDFPITMIATIGDAARGALPAVRMARGLHRQHYLPRST